MVSRQIPLAGSQMRTVRSWLPLANSFVPFIAGVAAERRRA
jgi:hypothetical protein